MRSHIENPPAPLDLPSSKKSNSRSRIFEARYLAGDEIGGIHYETAIGTHIYGKSNGTIRFDLG